MAREVRRYTATIPAGTPSTTPHTVDISFPPRIVRQITWSMPPGAQGVMGWRLAMGGIEVIPSQSDSWVLDNGTSGSFTLDGYPDSGAWQVIGYNTGTYSHSVYLVFHLDLPTPPVKIEAPIPFGALAPVPDLSRAGAPIQRRG